MEKIILFIVLIITSIVALIVTLDDIYVVRNYYQVSEGVYCKVIIVVSNSKDLTITDHLVTQFMNNSYGFDLIDIEEGLKSELNYQTIEYKLLKVKPWINYLENGGIL